MSVIPTTYRSSSKLQGTTCFSNDLKKCISAPRGVKEDHLLTIHLRGDDLLGRHVDSHDYEHDLFQRGNSDRLWRQPVCYFYEKIIGEKDYKQVLIITSQDLSNPCLQYLNDRRDIIRNKHGQLLRWELQTGSLVEDVCAMLRVFHGDILAPEMPNSEHCFAHLQESWCWPQRPKVGQWGRDRFWTSASHHLAANFEEYHLRQEMPVNF